MGILANHVPSVEALKAGVVEVIEDAGSQSKKWFSKSWFCQSREMRGFNGLGEVDRGGNRFRKGSLATAAGS